MEVMPKDKSDTAEGGTFSDRRNWYIFTPPLTRRSALGDLFGVPVGKVNDDRLYRALDALLPHKSALEKRIEAGLEKIADACRRYKRKPLVIERRIGRLLGANSRAAGLFKIDVKEANGRAGVVWSKVDAWREWSNLAAT